MLKKSDSQTIVDLPEEFINLRSLIEELRTEANGRAIDRELKWLGDPTAAVEDPASLWGRRWQAFARYTHQRFTFGQNSTIRSESINSGNTQPLPAACGRAVRARAHNLPTLPPYSGQEPV